MKNKIFLGCLPGNADKEELLDMFSNFGAIKKVKLKKRKRGVCTGHGYIICESEETCQSILSNAGNFEYKGRSIEVMPFLYDTSLKNYQESFNKKRIVVSNIPLRATSGDLIRLFEKMGDIHKAFVIENKQMLAQISNRKRNRRGKIPTQRGFVIFKDARVSDSVIKKRVYMFGTLLELDYFIKKDADTMSKASAKGKDLESGESANRSSQDQVSREKSLMHQSLNKGHSKVAEVVDTPKHSKFEIRRKIPNIDFDYKDNFKIERNVLNPLRVSKIAIRHHHRGNIRLNTHPSFPVDKEGQRCQASRQSYYRVNDASLMQHGRQPTYKAKFNCFNTWCNRSRIQNSQKNTNPNPFRNFQSLHF